MHHALEIDVILVEIFGHCCPVGLSEHLHKQATPDLVALARTCRSFKEPALDTLWRELFDLSPLARCIPGASNRSFPGGRYSFIRQLTQNDWCILRSYTHRIRFVRDLEGCLGLTRKSIKALSRLPDTESLFPNMHTLHYKYRQKTIPLLRMPLPSLVALDVMFESAHLLHVALQSFVKVSPNIKRLLVHSLAPEARFFDVNPCCICCWQHLSSLICPALILNVATLIHLSHLPTLIHLSFMLDATFPASDTILSFSNLHDLTIRSESLNAISRLLTQTRLPVLTDLAAVIDNYPSKQEFSSFFISVQTRGSNHAIQKLSLTQQFSLAQQYIITSHLWFSWLDFEDLQPCMAFRNLRHIDIDIPWSVCLKDRDVFTLASAWPRLQHFQINVHWGWNAPYGGITPCGLLRLWQACPLLSQVALALDTRSYIESPTEHAPVSLGLTLPPTLVMNVVDSTIHDIFVPAVAAFFVRIAAHSDFTLISWKGQSMEWNLDLEGHSSRWDDVRARIVGHSESGGSDMDIPAQLDRLALT